MSLPSYNFGGELIEYNYEIWNYACSDSSPHAYIESDEASKENPHLNSWLSTGTTPFATIRTEIINAAINFLEQRLDNKQEGVMKNIVEICGTKSINKFVVAQDPLMGCVGMVGDDMKEFTDTVIEIFDDLNLIRFGKRFHSQNITYSNVCC